ncbi:hypothetical protein P3X46_033554 [Hevea brasiliensis]|uniref:Pentatricopeptide repeat-containing protein n=1 Tax=Hevea brasiliensis TaxID=3981 RepID=A0ABQ9KCV4_HEVBR|nr:hypothetical protein P3X46_033554 [Hevea brasiliensis]
MPASSRPKPSSLVKIYLFPRKQLSTRPPCMVKFCQLAQAVSSLQLLWRKGIRLPCQTLPCLIQQCANTKSLKFGKRIHLHLNLTGFKDPMCFWYPKLRKIKPAWKLFDQMPRKVVVSWNTMVITYAQSAFCYEALRFYRELRNLEIGYNECSFAGLLYVCVKFKQLELTRQADRQVLVAGILSNLVISSSVVDAYAKCSEMSDARLLFDEMNVRDILAWTTTVSGYAQLGDMEAANELFDLMPEKNPVSWTALIAGYARHGLGKKALELFTKMLILHIRPDQFPFSSCLCACAGIISALAQHGHGEQAIQVFDDLVRLGMKPDGITLVVILSACSHSGLIDLLGHAGHFDKLMNQLEKMPCKPNDQIGNALVGVCRIHGNAEVGRKAAEQLIQLKRHSSTANVLLSTIYAALGRWESVEKVRERAVSWIDIENKLHSFTASDQLHPLKEVIYLVVEQLADHMKEEVASINNER